ncbi:MAG: 2-oxoglutarate/2-oxoacid ferredoxin oxidoreductase subunit beta, partial [Desulfomicrobiaceae bacterium]|nr:2-oxoglutarate/2-oxoacid ferredoxin oxidoreductase subunit beta [Desulfomicrobiaceae bacterium]
MLDTTIYGEFPTSWCPGCGNHDILAALKTALARLELAPHQFALVSGIGQAAKAPHYLHGNGFAGLHGRALPAAQALKLVQPELTVLV